MGQMSCGCYEPDDTKEAAHPHMKLDKAGTLELYTPDFEEAYKAAIALMIDIHDTKRNDYTGGNADPLANYRASAAIIDREAHHIMLARIQEKVNRVGVLFGNTEQQVADEKVTDTLLDIANIALLILAELESR